MKIGDKVKTNDFYMNYFSYLFEKNPIEAGIVTNITKVNEHIIVNVLENGKNITINESFLKVI